MSEVKINHVYKRYGSITVVDDFNLEVKDGEFISILGPSGCGKTTVLSLAAGLIRPSAGEVLVRGGAAQTGNIGYMLQKDELFPLVSRYGALPRKSFSMGEADEKRCYLEAKRIV